MALELLRKDAASGATYYGYAAAGTQDTDPFWSIKKETIIGSVTKYEYPYESGTTMANAYPAIQVTGVNYMKLSGLIWANRAVYTYR
jgi:hypothetical protein